MRNNSMSFGEAQLSEQLPSVVEVEVNSRCNRRCGYCPVSVLPVPPVPTFMSEAIFSRLLLGLKNLRFEGRFSYHFYNEPLLRKDLEHLTSRVAKMLPKAYQVLYTNGDFLDHKRYESLRLAGITLFVVTSHGRTVQPKRAGQVVRFPEDLTLTNRGGLISGLPAATSELLKSPCFAPAEMMIVTVVGDVLLCYEDAKREHVMGNLMKTSLEEIWFCKDFLMARDLLARGNREQTNLMCASCTNRAHIIQGTSWIP